MKCFTLPPFRKGEIISQSFYSQNTLIAAQKLLGCFLNRRFGDGRIVKAKIVETEAYIGQEDLACHASKGRTKRTEIMFGHPGKWYVYMIYGMYHCLNIITEQEGFPAAVLIRAVDFTKSNSCGAEIKGDGPGKLCRELQIDRNLNGCKAYSRESGLWITFGNAPIPECQIIASKRIGVEYAGEWAEKNWRFSLTSDAHL